MIFLLPAAGAWTEKATLGVFGYEVIWLMIAAFVIASGMEKSGLAKRLALFLVTRFGKSVNTVLIVLMVTNFLIAFVVPSTTARAVMLLPIVMMIMEVFEVGNTTPQDRNFWKAYGIAGDTGQQPFHRSHCDGYILPDSGYQLYQGPDRYGDFLDEVVHCLCSCCHYHTGSQLLIGKMLFKTGNRSASAEKMTALEEEYKGLGKMNGVEVRALIIFLITIFLWATDEYHGAMFGFDISLVVVAIVSAAHLPHAPCRDIDLEGSKDTLGSDDFQLRAYAGGLALDDTGVATWVLNSVFDKLGVEHMSFMVLYAVIILLQASPTLCSPARRFVPSF